METQFSIIVTVICVLVLSLLLVPKFEDKFLEQRCFIEHDKEKQQTGPDTGKLVVTSAIKVQRQDDGVMNVEVVTKSAVNRLTMSSKDAWLLLRSPSIDEVHCEHIPSYFPTKI